MVTPGQPAVEVLAFSGEPWDSSVDAEALARLHQSIAEGNHWLTAVLEAVALWRSSHEQYKGREYTYLIAGEAFDWLELADRLLEELGDLVPDDEREALLFNGQLPIEIGPWEFQRMLGRAKYRAHLNFWYGVMVEEALVVAVEERIAKEHAGIGLPTRLRNETAVYEWVYGTTQAELLAQYWEARGLVPADEMSLADYRKFIYWCFKYRVTHRDPAKVASDTRIGVSKLQQLYAKQGRRPLVI